MTPRVLAGPLAFVAVVLASLVVLFAPASTTPSALPPGVDKAVHLALFAALAWTGVLWIDAAAERGGDPQVERQPGRRAGLPVVGLAAGLVVYAAGSEVLQGLLPLGRTSDPLDAVVDVVGVALGLVAVRRPARR